MEYKIRFANNLLLYRSVTGQGEKELFDGFECLLRSFFPEPSKELDDVALPEEVVIAMEKYIDTLDDDSREVVERFKGRTFEEFVRESMKNNIYR